MLLKRHTTVLSPEQCVLWGELKGAPSYIISEEL